jgi:phosphohistidine phosphatase
MDLYILRHGLALDRSEWLHGKDRDRPLTKEGKKKMRTIAKAMVDLRLRFDWILSSPYVRAKDTAFIVAERFDLRKSVELREELTPMANPEEFTRLLASRQKALERVLVVGHEPYLSRFASVLLTGHSVPRMRFKKGGLCKLLIGHIRFGACAELDWLLTARQLTMIG